MILPFIPLPYPDEILGSWLCRVRLHNHPISFKAFTKQFMSNNIVEAGWRDISIYNRSFDDILQALGTSFDESLIKLTTYPYWLRFHSEDNYPSESFKTAAPAPKLVLNRIKNRASRFSYLRSNVIRVCPLCLVENLELYGEPYLHRSHHLPFVNVCYKHNIELISKCRACGIGFHADKTFIGASLICKCGSDLRQFIHRKTEYSPAWINLAKFSADALVDNSNIPICTDYFNFFNSQLSEFNIENRNDLLELLAIHFGRNSAKALLTLSPQKSDEYEFSAIGSVSRNELRAPQFCAFFAANKLAFKTVNQQFIKFHSIKNRGDIGETPNQNLGGNKTPISVDEARNFVHQLETAFPKNSIRSLIYKRYKTLFWYLTLFDKQWFENKYPNGGRGATKNLPTAQDDRVEILSAIKRASRPRITIWKNLAQQAYFRALLRDKKWLEIAKQETIKDAKNSLNLEKSMSLETIELNLKDAHAFYLNSKSKNIRISVKSIAVYTKFSPLQLRHLVSQNSNLKQYVYETYTEFKSRLSKLNQ